MSGKTYTEAEFAAEVEKSVAAATADLTARLGELEASKTQSEIEAAVEAAKAESAAALAETQSALDVAKAEAKAATDALEAIETAKTAQAAADALAAEVEVLKTERLAQVDETKVFDAEDMAANADRWAAMSAEDFDALLAQFKAIALKRPATAGAEPPPRTSALTAGAADGGDKDATVTSVAQKLLELTRPGWGARADAR